MLATGKVRVEFGPVLTIGRVREEYGPFLKLCEKRTFLLGDAQHFVDAFLISAPLLAIGRVREEFGPVLANGKVQEMRA